MHNRTLLADNLRRVSEPGQPFSRERGFRGCLLHYRERTLLSARAVGAVLTTPAYALRGLFASRRSQEEATKILSFPNLMGVLLIVVTLALVLNCVVGLS
jgi:hypothetical protein